MRSVLLHAHRDNNFEARLAVALDLTRAFDGHITLLQPIAFNVILPGDFYGVVAADTSPIARAEAKRFREEMEPRLRAEHVRWDWVDEIGLADAQMLQYAALSDIAVVGSSSSASDGGSGTAASLAGILAVHCKAPILIVPDKTPERPLGLNIGAPALIGWNGSLEASRALRAAVPLLQKSSQVYLAVIGRDEDDRANVLPSIAAARYLDRQGVVCEVVVIPRGERKIAHVIQDAARARGAGLIVMGAYGQSRLMETLFGGVTADMLKNPELPLLLSH